MNTQKLTLIIVIFTLSQMPFIQYDKVTYANIQCTHLTYVCFLKQAWVWVKYLFALCVSCFHSAVCALWGHYGHFVCLCP